MPIRQVIVTETQRARVLVALLAGTALLACSQSAPGPRGWVEVARIKTGKTPGPVTLGGPWAFIPNTSDGTVTEVDRTNGRVVATIRVSDTRVLRDQGCAPDSVHAWHSASWGWRACDTPYALAWDGSMLWAIDNGLKRLVRVDPHLHRATGAVDLPGTGWDVKTDANTAWVTGWEDDSLYVVDLRSQRVSDVVHDLDQGPSTLALAAGAVWVVCARGRGRLDRVDPTSARLLGRHEIEWWSLAVAAGRDALYIRGTNGGDISRLDPATGAISWTQLGPGFIGRNGIDQIAASADGIWVDGTTTVRLDPATGQVAETIPIPSAGVAAGDRELWLNRLDGSVSELRHA